MLLSCLYLPIFVFPYPFPPIHLLLLQSNRNQSKEESLRSLPRAVIKPCECFHPSYQSQRSTQVREWSYHLNHCNGNSLSSWKVKARINIFNSKEGKVDQVKMRMSIYLWKGKFFLKASPRNRNQEARSPSLWVKILGFGIPWWLSGKESTCWC